MYRDTYVNGVNAHSVPMRVTFDASISTGPPRTWQRTIAPRASWEINVAADLLTDGERANGMHKVTAILRCEELTPDGYVGLPCGAHVALWHAPIAFGVASTIYNVPFSCTK